MTVPAISLGPHLTSKSLRRLSRVIWKRSRKGELMDAPDRARKTRGVSILIAATATPTSLGTTGGGAGRTLRAASASLGSLGRVSSASWIQSAELLASEAGVGQLMLSN
eukprot:CAMPEP_0169431336 /NCGR_PEP_ID=MMETSP1042-20121227/2890_1 /TAXON_ID=464988 /ORGANISM="Hemiselmis andersenii, Strain CCMP1180" /LENGTH=108 /DNA_ID=CAMNT_0009541735 /DNA_START=236 /DNA_END=562 /DNA_ORIENTATION=+